MGLDRAEELAEFIRREWKMFTIHTIDPHTDACTCGRQCGVNAGKHPTTKHGVKDARVYYAASCFEQFNVGVATGNECVVLDVDVKTGGPATLKEIEEIYGQLPKTWTVITGGGGRHYYFKPLVTPQAAGCKLKAMGVELKGLGGYVVAPTSRHRNGSIYEWEVPPSECELAEIPQWLIDVTTVSKSKTTSSTSSPTLDLYTIEDVQSALCYLGPPTDRDEWTKIGMGLKASGFDFEVWYEWTTTSPKHKEREYSERVWDSFKGSGCTASTLIYLAKERGWSPPTPETCLWISAKKDPDLCEVEEELVQTNLPDYPPGALGELARRIEQTALHSHKSFAIASSLAVISALAQGSYASPISQGYLGTYLLFIAGASAGKEHYCSRVSSIVRSVSEQLLMGVPQSPQALRADLFECNNRTIVMDEGLRWIQSNSESKNAMDKNLLSDIMGIWGLSDPVLLGLATKKKEDRSPTIHNPHLSIVGCGTTEKLETLLRKSPSFVEDGTLSRFDFVLSDYAEPVSMLRKRPEFLVGHDLNSILISIAQKGIQHADVIDTKAQTKTDRTIYKKPVPVEFFDDEVAALWDDTQQAWSRRSRGQDRLASSIWNRAAEKALRVACLLAIVDSPENPVVTQAHIEWGLAWQEYLATQTSELVIGRVGQTDESRAREEILAALKNGHRTLGRIQKLSRFLSSVDRRVIVAAIDTLRDQGLVSTEKSQRGGIRLTPIDLA